MISINNLSKKFRENIVLDDVSLKLEKNITFLFGNNGVGKSTLINILAGAIVPDKGVFFLDNQKISFIDGSYKRKIGFLLSFPTYPLHFKVKEYVHLLNYVYSINPELNKLYQEDLITFFDLKKYMDTKISELSVGFVKRVQLLASMLHNPKYYIFDEPFSGMDTDFMPILNQKILDLSREGKYFLIATHQLDTSIFNDLNSEKFKIVNHTINKIS